MIRNVLITDRFALESDLWLRGQHHLQLFHSPHHQTLPADLLLKSHALVIRSRTPITEALLQKARQLQLVVTATSGFDHIDLAACTKWGVTVMHTPAANVESAAQLTFALVLGTAHRLHEARTAMARAEWNRERLIGMELAGRTYGVVGLGRIGQRVARLALAFGMKVIAFDPYIDEQEFARAGAHRVSLEDVFQLSDVISLHVPKTQETEGFITLDLLKRAARRPLLINTSRGSVIREEDLVSALQNNWLRGAGLDVFATEPLPVDSPLLNLPQVLLSPHVGANTEDAFIKASQLAAEKVAAFFLNGSTSDTLPPRVPWYGAPPSPTTY